MAWPGSRSDEQGDPVIDDYLVSGGTQARRDRRRRPGTVARDGYEHQRRRDRGRGRSFEATSTAYGKRKSVPVCSRDYDGCGSGSATSWTATCGRQRDQASLTACIAIVRTITAPPGVTPWSACSSPSAALPVILDLWIAGIVPLIAEPWQAAAAG